jgi:hypothetical protein
MPVKAHGSRFLWTSSSHQVWDDGIFGGFTATPRIFVYTVMTRRVQMIISRITTIKINSK